MYCIKMTPAWLCLLFTYFFTIYAHENSDQSNIPETKIKNQIKNLKELDGIPLFKTLVASKGAAPLENVVKSSEIFKELLLKSSATEKVADAGNPNFLKNLALNPMNFVKLFKRSLVGNPILRIKREDTLNEDQHLPINRLLDVTDRLFDRMASMDNMVENKPIDIETRNIDNNYQTQFTPIYDKNPKQSEHLPENRYTKMLENIFDTPDNSNPQLFSERLYQNHDEEEERIQPSPVAVPKINKYMQIKTDGPLVSYGLLIIRKIKKIILHLLQKLQGNRQVEGRVFAVSVLASFILAFSVSATRTFYFGYNISERICKFLTGNSGLTTCNPLSFFTLDRLRKGISNIMSYFGKRFLRIPGFSLSFD